MVTPNINPESIQEDVETSNKIKGSDATYLKDLSKKCARKKLSGDDYSNSIKNVDFYDRFNSGNYSKELFIEELKKYLNGNDSKDLLLMLEKDKNKVDELFDAFSREVNKSGYPFEKQRNNIKKQIDDRYDLKDIEKQNIFSKVMKLDLINLDKINDYTEDLDDFIKASIEKEPVKKRDFKDIKKIFEYFSFNSVEDFRNAIYDGVQKNPSLGTEEEVFASLTLISNKIKAGDNISSIDVEELMSYEIFNDDQKKIFIKTFLPTISLYELSKKPLSIISNVESEKKKKEILKNYLKDKYSEDISDDDQRLLNLINDIELKDIDVSTNDYIANHLAKLEKSERFIDIVTKSFNKTKESIKDKLISKILNLSALKNKLREDHNVRNRIKGGKESLDKLKDGIIFKFGISKEENSQFYEVTSFKDDGTFIWKNRSSNGKYNSGSEIKDKSVEYIKLNELLNSPKIVDIDIITKEELKSKIESGNIVEDKENLGDVGKLEYEKYKKEVNEKIENIKGSKTKEELENDNNYKELLRIKDKFDGESAMDDIVVKEILNGYLLTEKIDELDSEGKKFGLKIGVSFKVNEGDNKEFNVFTINNINQLSKTIEIKNAIGKVESLTFDQFYKGFKSRKGKVTRFTDDIMFSSLVDFIKKTPKLSSDWGDYSINDNKISKKGQDTITYPFLVQKSKEFGKSDKLLKIHDVVGTGVNQMVGISFGNVVQEESGEKDKKGNNILKDVYEVSENKEYVSVAFLENYVNEYKLKPKTIDKEKEEGDKIKPLLEQPRWGFFKRFLSNKSVFEIMKGLKMGFDEFRNHLKGGNEEHSARVALATWGKFLPTEVKTELKARVEGAEKKHMDDAVSRLSSVDTPDAIDLIYRRLNFTNTEEYKKEAALIFMLQKYGNLYNKNYTGVPYAPLNSRKGEFLWFKALSGYRGDVTKHELYIDTKKECETPDKEGRTRNFTEEELVWKLMKKQCSQHGYGGVHRRSRLHKEVEKLKKDGLRAEVDDGYKKANDTRNPSDQLIKGIDELKSGSPANCIGRFKKLVDRGDDMTSMNMIPMILIYSGVSSTLPDDLSDMVKGMIEEGRMITLARFMSYPKDIDLAMKAIRVISNKIQQRKPGLYPDIGNKANKLYDDLKSGTVTEIDRVNNCIKFFQESKGTNGKSYGEILTKVMYMSADGTVEDDSELSSLLLIEKDKPGEDSAILKDYFNYQKAYVGSIPIKKEYFGDSFKGRGTSSLGHQISRETLKQHSSGGFSMTDSDAGPAMVEEIQNEINATKRRTYDNEEDRKIWLKYYLKQVFAGLVESGQSKTEAVNALFKGVGPLRFFYDDWGINFQKFIDESINQVDILGESPKSEALFDKFVKVILNDEKSIDVNKNIFSILENKITKADDYNLQNAA